MANNSERLNKVKSATTWNLTASSRHALKVVTIWNTYGPYHIARVRALREAFPQASLICFSHCVTNLKTYPFFNLSLQNSEVLVPKDEANVSFGESLFFTLRLLNKHRPELVMTCGYERPESLGAVIYAKLKRKVCFLMVENQYEDRKRNTSIEFIKSIYLKLFDGHICGGVSHWHYLLRLGVDPRKIVTGYDCVDNDAIARMAAEFRASGAPSSTLGDYLLCIGRLIEKKNWVRLLLAYRQYVDRISSRRRPWRLVLVGDGPMRQAIEKQIQQLHLSDAVVMVGQVESFEDVVRWHALAKVFVLASHENEPWGLVVNEAMAAARPVLVSQKCGCALDLVRNGENGFTFDPQSPRDLAEKLVWLHSEEHCLKAMGFRSREIIEHYSPKFFAENVKALYEGRSACLRTTPDT